ncbi:hypothetical protein D6D05_10463 [Aureobasidium pullulans]|nr:hypothetical protein D6D05_10463 [Aureobasidium pullulans]
MISTYAILVNVPSGLRKDIRFAQLFGDKDKSVGSLTMNEANLSKVTIPTVPTIGFSKYALTTSLARDALTIFGSFIVFPRVAAAAPNNPTISSNHSAITSCCLRPHMLGPDLVARPSRIAYSARIKQVRYGLVPIALVRAARMLLAFGLGYILNGELKEKFNEKLADDHEQPQTTAV